MYLTDGTVISSHDTRNQPASSNQITPSETNESLYQSAIPSPPVPSHFTYAIYHPLVHLSIHFLAFPDRDIVSCGWLLHLATSLVDRTSPCSMILWYVP